MAKRKRLGAPDLAAAQAPEVKTMLSDAPLGQVPPHRLKRAPIADVAGDAATVAALERVAGELSSAKAEGRMIVELPFEAVAASHLIRDRVSLDAAEMEALKASLKARGQQTPIEVVETGPGRYGLISGWRRLSALKELAAEGGVSTVQALIRRPESAAEAYTAMVEENEIRVGLSYFERANVALRAVEEGVFRDAGAAIAALFAAASRAKRSKIKSFVPLVDFLGRYLEFPAAITERQGLALAARIAEDAAWAARLKDRLRKTAPEDAEAQTLMLQKALEEGKGGAKPTPKSAAKPAPAGKAAASEAPALSVQRSKSGLRISGPGLSDALVARIEDLVRSWRE